MLRLHNGDSLLEMAYIEQDLDKPQRRWRIDWTSLNECCCAREKEACLQSKRGLREASAGLVYDRSNQGDVPLLVDASLQVLEKNVEHLFASQRKK